MAEIPRSTAPSLYELSREQLEKLLVKVDDWNARRSQCPGFMPNLENAILNGVDLTGADLTDVILRGAHLNEANLSTANLNGADLNQASLNNAQLKTAKGLREIQFSGADLSGAILPNGFRFDALKAVEETSRNARTIFITFIIASVFCLLSCFRFSDFQLIMGSGEVALPFVSTSVPLVIFFQCAPLLLLFFYLYFHLYLQHLWRELAQLPAVFPNGKTIIQKAYPWLLNGWVRSHIKVLASSQSLSDRFLALVSRILGWCLGPFVLTVIWVIYLVCHQSGVTAYHITLLAITILIGDFFYRDARRTLRNGYKPKAGWIKKAAVFLIEPLLILFIVGISFFSYQVMHGSRVTVPAIAKHIYPNISHEEFTAKPKAWAANESNIDLADSVRKKQFKGINLNHADAREAFLVQADLSGAWLKGVDFSKAALQSAVLDKANLTEATLNNANLNFANMEETVLDGAYCENVAFNDAMLIEVKFNKTNLIGADFTGATVNKTDFSSALLSNNRFTNAKLIGVILSKINLSDYNFEGVDLTFSDFHEAVLSKANFGKATLRRANLQKAILREANLRGADLRGANLQKADLTRANMTSAMLENAKLHGAKLQGCSGLTSAQLANACFDKTTILPNSLSSRLSGFNNCRPIFIPE